MYDLICIGAGIANLSLAYRTIKESLYDNGGVHHSMKVLIIEKGPKITTRICPKSKLGYCVNCKPCRITTGFGGAGCFSDCKLTYSKEVGGTLIDYVKETRFKELQNEAYHFFRELGADAPVYSNSEYFEELQKKCEDNSLHLVESKVQHLGTEGSYELMCKLYDKLEKMGCTILCNTSVVDINFDLKSIMTEDGFCASYNKLSIAVGRYGNEWLRSICKKNNISLEENSVDIGVRVEVPKEVLDPITDNLYEMKIVNKTSGHSSVRTFCVNPGGFVVQENYDDVRCVNGHSFAGTKSSNSNFALLCSCKFTEPFNDPVQYGKAICKLSNMLGGEHIIVQRLGDIYNNKRTTRERLDANEIQPTLKDAEPGDIRYALPEKILDAIISTIHKLENVIPGVSNACTLLYSPEVKFYSSKIKLNESLQVPERSDLKDVYFLGDSSGVTHGIIQACMSGLYVASIVCGFKERDV